LRRRVRKQEEKVGGVVRKFLQNWTVCEANKNNDLHVR